MSQENQQHMALQQRVAHLESVNDQLVSELRYVDNLLRSIGFTDGLETVKRAAIELQQQEFDDLSE